MGRDGKLQVPDQPDHPVHRGRRHRAATSGARRCACSTPRSRRPTAARRKIAWFEVSPARRRSRSSTTGCPTRRVDAFRKYLVGIKGPLTTPIGGGIRSLNVALRQMLDLYVCLRPVRWFKGVPSPVKRPQKVDMVIFRENTEDIYAGIEFEAGSRRRQEGPRVPQAELPDGVKKIRFPGTHRASASSRCRARAPSAWCAPRSSYAHRAQAQERDARAQGQHHEVHRGRLPRLGLRARRARVRRQGLHLGSVGAHQGSQGRRRGQRRAERGAHGRQGPDQGRDRRHHAAAGADAPDGVRRDRDAEPERRLPLATRSRRRSAASASRRAATSTTSPATPSSRPPTAPRRSTPTRTR